MNVKRYVFKNKWWFIYIFLLSLISSLLMVGLNSFYYLFITLLENKLTFNNILILGGICLAYLFVTIFFQVVLLYNILKYSNFICKEYTKDLVKNIFNLDYADFKNRTPSEYLSIINNDINNISKSYFENVLTLPSYIFTLTFLIAYSTFLNYIATLIALLLSIFIIFIPKIFSKKVEKRQEEVSKANMELASILDNAFNGQNIIYNTDSFNKISTVLDRYIKKVVKNDYSLYKSKQNIHLVSRLSMNLLSVILLLVSGILCIYGYLDIAIIVTLVNISSNFLSQATYFVSDFIQIKSVKLVVDKISEIKPKKEVNKKDVSSFDSFILKDVSIKVKSKDLLSSTSFKFEKNKKYLLVGESGIGKTTLLETLIKHNSSYQGQIIIDKIDLKDVSNNSINKLISYCQQKPYLFIGSLKDNITMFDNNVDEKQLKKVIKDCQLEDFAYKRGMDSILDNSKNTISLGEMQRISLARALYSKKEVLFLDEVTSSLDKDNVNKINDVIKNIKNKTIIWISHQNKDYDYSFIDEIVQIKQNKLIKEG